MPGALRFPVRLAGGRMGFEGRLRRVGTANWRGANYCYDRRVIGESATLIGGSAALIGESATLIGESAKRPRQALQRARRGGIPKTRSTT
jgi:hypothetical protein